jgi:hypothetical protein
MLQQVVVLLVWRHHPRSSTASSGSCSTFSGALRSENGARMTMPIPAGPHRRHSLISSPFGARSCDHYVLRMRIQQSLENSLPIQEPGSGVPRVRR